LGGALGEAATIRRFPAGVAPVAQARALLGAVAEADRTVHVQFVPEFFSPVGAAAAPLLAATAACARHRDVRLVVTVHEVWDENDTGPLLRRAYARGVHEAVARAADDLVFLSEAAGSAFTRYAPSADYRIVAHGVQTSEVRTVPDAKARFGYDEETTLVTQHGFVNPLKGCETFLELARSLSDTSFLLAGGPRTEEHRQYYETIVEAAPGNVQCTGRLDGDDFHAAFAASDLVVLPYRDIFQSGILNWCAGYSLPVVASDVPYFEEIARDYGAPATVHRTDREAVVATVRRLLDDLGARAALGDRLHAYAVENDMCSVAETYRAIYAGREGR
jgi:glycosyltransferase involved in cell wall biosynthesis